MGKCHANIVDEMEKRSLDQCFYFIQFSSSLFLLVQNRRSKCCANNRKMDFIFCASTANLTISITRDLQNFKQFESPVEVHESSFTVLTTISKTKTTNKHRHLSTDFVQLNSECGMPKRDAGKQQTTELNAKRTDTILNATRAVTTLRFIVHRTFGGDGGGNSLDVQMPSTVY